MPIRLPAALLVVLAIGCDRSGSAGAPDSSLGTAPSPVAAVSAPSARRPQQVPLVGERVEIPGGVFEAGSEPGEAGRLPSIEQRKGKVELGPFRIDKLPYPNDPREPSRTGVTRDEAKRLCAERDERLCTELEWERACRGPAGDAWSGGAAFDARCAEEPRSCASGFEVLALGAAIREWTASDVRVADGAASAAVRGAGAKEADGAHRCAARRASPADGPAPELGFRCCAGPPNAAVVDEPASGAVFERAKLEPEALSRLLAQSPETASLTADLKYFRDPEAAGTVIERGPGDRKGFDFTVAPLFWSPVPGARFLIVVARSGKDTSFVAAYWVLGEGRHRLAASFVMKNEPGPVALAYSESIRPRLHFSTCWGCPGETGKILFREPESVSITQP